MHAMGLIVVSIVGNEEKYYTSVGIKKRKKRIPKQIHKKKEIPKYKTAKTNTSPTQKEETSSLNMNTVIKEYTKVRWESR